MPTTTPTPTTHKALKKPIRDLLDLMRCAGHEVAQSLGVDDGDPASAAEIAERIAELLPADAKKDSQLTTASRRATSLALALGDAARREAGDDNVSPTAPAVYGFKLIQKLGAAKAIMDTLGGLVSACARHGIDLGGDLGRIQACTNKKGDGFVQRAQGKFSAEAKTLRLLLGAAAGAGVSITETQVLDAFLRAVEEAAQAA